MTEVTNADLLEKLNEALEQGDQILEAVLGEWIPPTEPVDLGLPIATMRNKAPLMEVSNYDGGGKPVLRLHKYGGLKLGRIRAKAGKELQYLSIVKTAQGPAIRLYSGQQVDGKWLTESNSRQKHPVTKRPDKYFYILKRLVKI